MNVPYHITDCTAGQAQFCVEVFAAFLECRSLEYVEIQGKETTVKSGAFRGCPVKEMVRRQPPASSSLP